MKLDFREKFTLEIPLQDGTEEVIKGTIREFTKTEQKEIEASLQGEKDSLKKLNKLIRKGTRLEEKINRRKETLEDEALDALYDELDIITDEIETLSESVKEEDIALKGFRIRFDKTINSDKKDKLKNICEEHGYQIVFKTIAKDVEEKKPKE